MSYKLIKITKSDKDTKKMMAIFENRDTERRKTVHFGAKGYSDFTIHKDKERKQRYINRHSVNEDWTNPISAGTLSYFVLWNKPSLRDSIADYKRRFRFN